MTPTSTPTAPATAGVTEHRGALAQVVLATLASAVGFWAWMIISPLASTYREWMSLDSAQQSLVIATPVLVGSLGRIVVGAMTDRFGARRMFVVILLLPVPAVIAVMIGGVLTSFWLLLVAGFFLGIAGTIFAIGIPFASAWFPPQRRGLANGIFGMGMIGTAVSAFLTPRLVSWIGYVPTHLVVIGLMIVTAAVVWFTMKESPSWQPSKAKLVPKVAGALRLPVTWQMCFLYGIVFGGFVAFSTYLPTYLKDVYDVGLAGAGARTAGFAVVAVVLRPIGGVLADRVGPWLITCFSLTAVAVLAFLVSLRPAGEIPTGTIFLLMAGALGLGMGAVFAWVPRRAPADRVGAVTGVVAAAGGLGGYFPPLIMGATYDPAARSYAIGLWLLVATSLVALVFTLIVMRPRRTSAEAGESPAEA
ncbi:nitrate/nitrite transporter [Propionibacteriaceae bacterium Y2011]|uniref:nitrate/nitrite transporter n=1 Tax=Microlunatus sp. Y2014 TaxID=3418488 RepID=UPI003B46DE13